MYIKPGINFELDPGKQHYHGEYDKGHRINERPGKFVIFSDRSRKHKVK
jgi:hypothetical protein